MPKKIQKINVVDLECTCWDNGVMPDGRNQRDHMEIIEIGIVQFDPRTLEIDKKESYLVKPKDNPELSKYCVDLTGITQEMLNVRGTTLEYAIARMMSEFKTAKYEWMSWGDFDRQQVEKECSRKGLQYPFKNTHTNFKYWFSLLTNQNVQRNVNGALDFMNMKFEGSPHRGVDDAYNISRLYIEVMKKVKEC